MSVVQAHENGAAAFARQSGNLADTHRIHLGFAAIAGALLWRSWRDQRRRLAFLFCGAGLLSVVLCTSVLFAPGLLTGPTQIALHHMIQAHPEMRQSGSAALLAAFFLGQGPFLLALFAAAAAGNLTRSMIAFDVARGGFEVLLSAPYPAATLFGAYIVAGLAMTALSWGCVALPSIGTSLAACAYAGVTVGHLVAFLALGLLTSVAMAVWGTTATTYASITAPVLMGVQSGASQVIPNMIAILPALIIFAVINLFPAVNLMIFGIVALGASLACAAAACVALGRNFRVTRLLTSH